MSNYRRTHVRGGCYFFTVVTHRRRPLFDCPSRVDLLRSAVRVVQSVHPFAIDAMVVLPDHVHAVWQLPEGDADYSRRWRDIKHHVSTAIDAPVNHRGEKAVWQRRFWEHAIRDDEDWRRHVDYIHYNAVKHRLVESPAEWPYSSFHAAVRKGWYDANWGALEPDDIRDWWLE